jgi:hypothetical protein
MNLKNIKTLSSIKNLKAYFKKNKLSLIKSQLLSILSALSLGSLSALIVFITPKHSNAPFLEAIEFSITFVSIMIGMVSIMGLIVFLIIFVSMLFNVYQGDDFNLKEDNLNNLDSYIDIKSMLNLLLSTSLTMKASHSLSFFQIEEVEKALNYNQALLKTAPLSQLPQELSDKFNANLTIINNINYVIRQIHDKKLIKNQDFIHFLESSSFEQKEIQKKEYNLTLKELEEKVNKNLNISNLSSKTNENQYLIKNKVMAKTLSL